MKPTGVGTGNFFPSALAGWAVDASINGLVIRVAGPNWKARGPQKPTPCKMNSLTFEISEKTYI